MHHSCDWNMAPGLARLVYYALRYQLDRVRTPCWEPQAESSGLEDSISQVLVTLIRRRTARSLHDDMKRHQTEKEL
jgi:hypothetical protein